jgi:hypothetical protein
MRLAFQAVYVIGAPVTALENWSVSAVKSEHSTIGE